MTDDEIFLRLQAVVRKTFGAAGKVDIGRTTTSADIDGWDSLSHSILIMNVEEAFGVDLPLDAAFALNDLGELTGLVASALRDEGKV